MAVKVPPLLHKMSATAQKAWYKKHGMEMPKAETGRSAAQAKKDVGEINKQKARQAAIAAAAASKKNKELVSSSERVRQMAKRRRESGEGLGGGLETNRDIISYVRAGGTIKAGRLGEENIQEGNPATKEKVKNYVRGLGVKATIKGLVPFDQIHSPLRSGRKVLRTKTTAELKKEEASPMIKPPTNRFDKKSDAFAHVEKHGGKVYKQTYTNSKGQQTVSYSVKKEEFALDEVTKKEAETVLGGEVKEKPKMPPGKQPAGYRYVRGLARKAMKSGIKKRDDESERMIRRAMEKEMTRMGEGFDPDPKDIEEAVSFGRSGGVIHYNPKTEKSEKDGTAKLYDPETERMQRKLASGKMSPSQVMAKMKKEEVEYIEEKLTAADPASKWISDFVKSDNPKFAGKSKKERINQALGAYYAATRGKNEAFEIEESKKMEKMEDEAEEMEDEDEEDEDEEEEMNERYMGFKKLKASISAKGGARDPAAVAAAIGRKKYGKEKFQAMAAAGKKAANEEVEQIDELKKSTLASYVNKAANQVRAKTGIASSFETQGARKKDPEDYETYMNLAKDFRQGAKKRLTGIEKATGKLAKEALDPVGREDKDVDNDGDSDKTDVYLSKRRKAVSAAIRKKVADKMGK
jgi:hypothetical protein